MHSPRHADPLSRRDTLRLIVGGAATIAALAAGGCAVAEKIDPEPHRLEPLYDSAVRDADMIDHARSQLAGDSQVAVALGIVADARRTHRDALARSLAADDAPPETSTATPPDAPSPSPGVESVTPRQVAARLSEAAREAREVAAADVGYRRVLAAAIAASCTAAAQVVLTPVVD